MPFSFHHLECQKLAKDTKWEGTTPLDPDDLATKAIIVMELNWLIDYDNISIGTTGSDFITVDHHRSIRAFKSSTSRISFSSTPEAHNFEKEQYRQFSSKEMLVTTDEATEVKKMHGNLLTDCDLAEEMLHSMSVRGTTVKHNFIQDYATNRLESAKGPENPLALG